MLPRKLRRFEHSDTYSYSAVLCAIAAALLQALFTNSERHDSMGRGDGSRVVREPTAVESSSSARQGDGRGPGKGRGRGRGTGVMDTAGLGRGGSKGQRVKRAAGSGALGIDVHPARVTAAEVVSSSSGLVVHDDDIHGNDVGKDSSAGSRAAGVGAAVMPSRGMFCRICTFENPKSADGSWPTVCSCCQADLPTPEDSDSGGIENPYPSLPQSHEGAGKSRKNKATREDPGGSDGKWRGPLFIPTQSRQPTVIRRADAAANFPRLAPPSDTSDTSTMLAESDSVIRDNKSKGKESIVRNSRRDGTVEEPTWVDGELRFDADVDGGAALAAYRSRNGTHGKAWGSQPATSNGNRSQTKKNNPKRAERAQAWSLPADDTSSATTLEEDPFITVPVRSRSRHTNSVVGAQSKPNPKMKSKKSKSNSKANWQAKLTSNAAATNDDHSDDNDEFVDVQETEPQPPQKQESTVAAAVQISEEQAATAAAERNKRMVRSSEISPSPPLQVVHVLLTAMHCATWHYVHVNACCYRSKLCWLRPVAIKKKYLRQKKSQ